jgi:signal transduction histidine kinase
MDSTEEVAFIFWTGTLTMIFLAVVLLFLVVFYQNHLAKIKQQETALLLKSTLTAEKKERQRLAKDLHDGVQSDLLAIKNYLEVLSKQLNTSKANDLLLTIKDAIDQTSENTRMISHKLMPPLLETSGFEGAIMHYFEKLSNTTGLLFKVEINSLQGIMSDETAYELFRIVQELTTNMLKYGSITTCSLLLTYDDNQFQISLIDDNVRFNFKESYALSKGAGLQNIQSRLNVLQATLTQISLPKGNHYIIQLKPHI